MTLDDVMTTILFLLDESALSGRPEVAWLPPLRSAIESLIAAPAAQPVPAGWRMVPVEPTDAMIKAIDGLICSSYLWPVYAYRTMLDAAPLPPNDTMTAAEARAGQQLAGIGGATAWHLIERHADDWGEVGTMMNAWLDANRSPHPLKAALSMDGKPDTPQQAEPVAEKRVYLVATGDVIAGQDVYTRHNDRPLNCDVKVLYTHPPPAEVQRLRDAARAFLDAHDSGGLMTPRIDALRRALEGGE